MEFNLAQVHEAVEAAVGDRPCIITPKRTYTYTDIGDRSRRLANALLDRGFSTHVERPSLDNHESGLLLHL